MAIYSVDDLRRIVAPIAQEHGVKSVSLFGSYSRGTAKEDSYVDPKIEKGKLRSLFEICGFRLAIEDALHLTVDLVTTDASDKEFLNLISKDEVLLHRNAGQNNSPKNSSLL